MLAVLPAGCLFDEGPRTGPGLEPPGVPTTGVVDMGVSPPAASAGSGAFGNPGSPMMGGTSGGSAAPVPAAGTGGAGMSPPPAIPPETNTGTAGSASGAAGSGAPAGDPDAGGTVCEEERVPALAVDQRIIAPPGDAGQPDPEQCKYSLPVSAAPYLPDRVNLEHTNEGQRVSVPRVDDAEACDPQLGGFYYESALFTTRIVACPATCERIAQGGMVEIVLGCPTQTLP